VEQSISTTISESSNEVSCTDDVQRAYESKSFKVRVVMRHQELDGCAS
jgi:hypothetical protein